MTPLLAAASLALLLFGGWGLAALLFPEGRSFSEMAAHSWLLGAILVTLALALSGAFLSGAALLAFVSVVAVLPGAFALQRILRKKKFAFELPRPHGWLEWTLCAVILCQWILLLRFARTTALGWDGLMVWEIKARIAFYNGGGLPADYFTDPQRVWSHPDYPLLVPMLETWVYMWLGRADQSFARVVFPFFYMAALFLLYSGVSELTGKRWAGLLTAAMLFFVPFVTVGYFSVFTGYADFPLAVFYLAAAVCLFRYLRDSARSRLLLFAIYAGALPWTKHEGNILWICIVAVAAWEFIRRGGIRLAFLAAAPGLAVIVGWRIAMISMKAAKSRDFVPLTIANVIGNANRIGTILHYLIGELCSLNDWSLLWILFPIALLLLAARGKARLGSRLGSMVYIPLMLYACVYLLSDWPSYQLHIERSLPRLISQLSLVALLTLGLALPVLREEKPGDPTP